MEDITNMINNKNNTTEIVNATPTKTGRKNKTNSQLKLMTGHFTITQLMSENIDMKEITLRVKLKKLVDDGTVTELGTLHMAKGRPKLVFATAPLSKQTIESARTEGVLFSESMNVKILDITDSKIVDPVKTVDSLQSKVKA